MKITKLIISVIAGMVGGLFNEGVLCLGFAVLMSVFVLLGAAGFRQATLGDLTEAGMIIRTGLCILLVVVWALGYVFSAAGIGVSTYKRLLS